MLMFSFVLFYFSAQSEKSNCYLEVNAENCKDKSIIQCLEQKELPKNVPIKIIPSSLLNFSIQLCGNSNFKPNLTFKDSSCQNYKESTEQNTSENPFPTNGAKYSNCYVYQIPNSPDLDIKLYNPTPDLQVYVYSGSSSHRVGMSVCR